jgi:hypothetical protein
MVLDRVMQQGGCRDFVAGPCIDNDCGDSDQMAYVQRRVDPLRLSSPVKSDRRLEGLVE